MGPSVTVREKCAWAAAVGARSHLYRRILCRGVDRRHSIRWLFDPESASVVSRISIAEGDLIWLELSSRSPPGRGGSHRFPSVSTPLLILSD